MKIFIKIIIVLILIFTVVFLVLDNNDKKLEIQNETYQEKSTGKEEIVNPVVVSNKNEIKKEEIKIETEKVFLNVLDQKYIIPIKEGDTVYKAMQNLTKEKPFSFVSKEYSGLGVFIDEINGIKGERGKYWFYYINDVEASMSVSKQVLHDGDIISWKLK